MFVRAAVDAWIFEQIKAFQASMLFEVDFWYSQEFQFVEFVPAVDDPVFFNDFLDLIALMLISILRCWKWWALGNGYPW